MLGSLLRQRPQSPASNSKAEQRAQRAESKKALDAEAIKELAIQTETLARINQLLGVKPKDIARGEQHDPREFAENFERESVRATLPDGSVAKVFWAQPDLQSPDPTVGVILQKPAAAVWEEAFDRIHIAGEKLTENEKSRYAARVDEALVSSPDNGERDAYYLRFGQSGDDQYARPGQINALVGSTFTHFKRKLVPHATSSTGTGYGSKSTSRSDESRFKLSPAVTAAEPLQILRTAWDALSQDAGVGAYDGPFQENLLRDTAGIDELKKLRNDQLRPQGYGSKFTYFD